MIIHFNTEKRKTQKGKKEDWIRGRLVCPLTVGRPAVILVGNNICRTLPVLALHKETATEIHFETPHAHCHLSFTPLPADAAKEAPAKLTACA